MTHNGTENARLVCPDWDERDCPRMCGEDGCHMAQSVVPREPDESDDLPAIVRYHGARDVIAALFLVAAEAYGQERAVEKVHDLFWQSAWQECSDGQANTCTHMSATGIDTAPIGPEKVWRCDHCGLTWKQGDRA